MNNWLALNGGKVLDFLITSAATVTAAAPTLHLNQEDAAMITVGAAILKIAENVFVPNSTKAQAYIATNGVPAAAPVVKAAP